jgi:hypothetical protein
VSFDDIATQLQMAIDHYFPEESGVEIIAEPGRFYAHSAMSLVVNVTARRTIQPRMADTDLCDSSEEGEHPTAPASSSSLAAPDPHVGLLCSAFGLQAQLHVLC